MFERGSAVAVSVRSGNDRIDHPKGYAISVTDGHLHVYRSTLRGREDLIAIYAPGKWANAKVVEDGQAAAS